MPADRAQDEDAVTGLTVDLSGRRALVTGAGQGIGRLVSRYLAAAGAEVLVNDIDPDRASAVASELPGRAPGRPVVFDVTDWPSVQRAVDEAGPVDILVNNAGNAGSNPWELRPFHETEPDHWDRYLDVNLYGVMHCTRAVLPGMIPRPEGRIITVVSDAGRTGEATLAPYAAAKAGAAGFCRSIAREVGQYGITVNCVAMGTMLPPGADPDSEPMQKNLNRYVIRRRGQPQDAAGIITYLASPSASWITGQTYPVNGGYSFGL
jgi:3-oxoacyl-[acyl-carrier protein] reductase